LAEDAMTAPALLRQLAEPALDAYQGTVTVTVPTRLLTALADLDAAASRLKHVSFPADQRQWTAEETNLARALNQADIAAAEHEAREQGHVTASEALATGTVVLTGGQADTIEAALKSALTWAAGTAYGRVREAIVLLRAAKESA
jgi:hypothetical protein